MGNRRLKAVIIGSFVLAAGVFYFSDADGARAQRVRRPQKKESVLASVVGYRSWNLVSKPEPGLPGGTLRITDSSIAG
jgi:hypothetical protein